VLERKALAVNQSDGIAHLNLAWALARQGKWKEALHEYDQATVYEPRIAECWVGLGLAQMHNQMPTLAEKTLSDACQKFPKVALPHVALSQLLATTGQFGAAQQELQKAIDTQPDSADALERVAAQELNAENWDKAADIYSDVIRKFPQESQAWLGLALALEKTQFKQKSLDCFRRAAALSPKDSLVHMALALAYEERGRIPEAETELQEALRLNPDYRVAASQLKQQAHP
jgi:tetratricopeptide (TPR) repeat protein